MRESCEFLPGQKKITSGNGNSNNCVGLQVYAI